MGRLAYLRINPVGGSNGHKFVCRTDHVRGTRRLRRVAAALAIAAFAAAGCASSAGTLSASGLAASNPTTQATGAGNSAFVASLNTADRDRFVAWYQADKAHDRALDAFWNDVEEKRTRRRARMRARQAVVEADYVLGYPPEFAGPVLSAGLKDRWEAFQRQGQDGAASAREPIPGVNDMLAAAKSHYGFVPERVSEAEFKYRYAREAVALGLTKTQVIRVYALETGGNGTADMQAGIHPITGKGRPISSALGYAQLLHANTIGVLVKSGNEFLARLKELERSAAGNGTRVAALRAKQTAVRRMLRAARRVPDRWASHVAFGRTSKGLGIHALNIDGDIGPWLQTTKLKGIIQFAARHGRTGLTSEELELMNLAGPGTGIEMMTPIGRRMSNVNFFSRQGYGRNSVVRGRSASELLVELGRRMDDGERKPGAREFAGAFDKLSSRKIRAVNR